jgi:NAD(P)H dehydrogenase (quinone)
MNVLIVHAHPEPKSFVAAMKDVAVEVLGAAGHAVTVSDLYATGFDPVAKAADFAQPANPDYLVYALEQRHAYETGTLAPDIAAEVEKLKAADLLILSFPVFWFSLPAILKGWIDRVFLSGLAYGGRRFYDRGGFKGKKAMAAAALGGGAHMFGPGAVHGELEDGMLRHILRGTLYYVGMDVLPPFIAHHVPYITAEARHALLEGYRAHLGNLERLQPLPYPSLADFDQRMYPIKK